MPPECVIAACERLRDPGFGSSSRTGACNDATRTAADVLSKHVVFELESVDRMRLNVRQPRLQYGAGVWNFFVRHRGWRFASTALMAPMTENYVAEVDHYVDSHQLARERFDNGQRKDEVTQKYLAGHDGSEGVLYVGIAQERATVWTSTRRRNPLTGATYAWLKKTSKLVNHIYWYCFDDDFGPFLLRVCTYFPFNAQLIVNGNHWAQRQASKAGTGFTPLDNGFADCDDVAGLQAICESFGGAHIEALLIKWQQRLPQPFTEEDENLGGYYYQLALDQAEFSLRDSVECSSVAVHRILVRWEILASTSGSGRAGSCSSDSTDPTSGVGGHANREICGLTCVNAG